MTTSIITQDILTMTSRDIADLVELRHDNVKKTIDNLALAALINRPKIEDGIKSGNGVVEKVYVIGKRMALLMRYIGLKISMTLCVDL